MEMISVESKSISSIGYDYDNAVLRIEFLRGKTYNYYQVPAELYESLMAFTSKGTFLHQYIKNGAYPYAEV